MKTNIDQSIVNKIHEFFKGKLNVGSDLENEYLPETIRWKDVKGFAGYYIISSVGTVINIKTGEELKPHFSGVARRNYYQVTLYRPGVKRTVRVHSLMAENFLGFQYTGNRKLMVDHIDNNPLNNKLGNLRIVNAKQNHWRNREAGR